MKPRLAALLVPTLLLAPAPVREHHPASEPTPPPLDDATHRDDLELLRLSGLGRFAEVLQQGQSRLTAGSRSCLLANLTADAAEQEGRLPELIHELEEARRREPRDDTLLLAHALSLHRQGRDWPARNLLAFGVHHGAACPEVFQGFVELSQSLGRLAEATVAVEQLRRVRADDPGVLLARAYAWDLRGDAARALSGYQEAILTARPLAATHRYYALLLTNTGQFERAAYASRIGAGLARRNQEPYHLASLLAVEGVSLDWMEQPEASRRAFADALQVARDAHLFALEARILVELSILYGTRGRIDTSLTYLSQAQQLDERVLLPRERTRYLIRLGNALASRGENDSAMTSFSEALHLAEAHPDPSMELEARLQIASAKLAGGDANAIDLFRTSYDRALLFEDGRSQGRAWSGLGAAYERLGSFARAMGCYQRAMELAHRAGDRHAEAIAVGNVGLIYFRLNQPSPALLYSARATQVARELKDLRLEASLLNGLAASLAGLGRLDQAQQVYRRALDVAANMGSPDLEGAILTGWSRVTLARGDTAGALAGFERATELARVANNLLILVQALYGLGQSFAQQKELQRAAQLFEETLNLVESMRAHIPTNAERMSYLETRAAIYASLADVLLQQQAAHPTSGYRERAFAVIERSRARTLLDVLSFSDALPETSSRVNRIDVPTTLGSVELRTRILRPGEILLEYTLGESRSILWVLTPHDLRTFDLPPRRDIETMARSFLESLRSPPRSPWNPFAAHLAPARSLFGTLVGPVADLLGPETRLIVVPDGILHHLPFEALVHDDPDGRPVYLAERAVVSYVPSASVLGYLRRRPRPKTHALDFLGVAQPGGSELLATSSNELDATFATPIPFASVEVERVAELFPAPRRRTYIGADVTESSIKSLDLDRFRVLHFAAHAMTDETFPSRSAILLGPATDRDDGLLRMDEVLGLHLSSELVVLSGCQTGVGQLLRSEGVFGFTWAFLSAGSSAIVASQWNVNDRSTAGIMEAFYSGMSEGLTPGEALRAAKLAMLDSERPAYRHPYYWAPFLLVGDEP